MLRRRWSVLLAARGLAGELTLRHTVEGVIHGYSETYLFLDLFLLRAVIEPRWEPGDGLDAELIAKLEQCSIDAKGYSISYRWHYRIATFRRWVAMPVRLGGRPSLFLGIGRYSRLLIMNVDQSASAPLAWMSIDKAYGRDVLASHGFPVAPGAVATTSNEVAARARELGFPVAVKKARASADSDGVILGLETESACIDAAARLLAGDQTLIVERMLQGIELRLHFIHGRLFRILQSEPLHGNRRRRGYPCRSPGLAPSPLFQDRFSHGILPAPPHPSVFPAWRPGFLRSVTTGSAKGRDRARLGGDGSAHDPARPDAIHPADRRALEEFLARYGSPGAGVDIILPSLGARLDSGGAILEMNIPCGLRLSWGRGPARRRPRTRRNSAPMPWLHRRSRTCASGTCGLR